MWYQVAAFAHVVVVAVNCRGVPTGGLRCASCRVGYLYRGFVVFLEKMSSHFVASSPVLSFIRLAREFRFLFRAQPCFSLSPAENKLGCSLPGFGLGGPHTIGWILTNHCSSFALASIFWVIFFAFWWTCVPRCVKIIRPGGRLDLLLEGTELVMNDETPMLGNNP